MAKRSPITTRAKTSEGGRGSRGVPKDGVTVLLSEASRLSQQKGIPLGHAIDLVRQVKPALFARATKPTTES